MYSWGDIVKSSARHVPGTRLEIPMTFDTDYGSRLAPVKNLFLSDGKPDEQLMDIAAESGVQWSGQCRCIGCQRDRVEESKALRLVYGGSAMSKL